MPFGFAGRCFTLGLVVAALGCGRTPISPEATLAFSLSATPAAIAGALCTGCGAGSTDRESKTTISIRETGGAAGTVSSIAMVLRDSANAVITQGEFDAGGVASLAGTSRVAAGGTLNVLCGVHYPAAQQGKAATLTYTVRVTDDRGNVVTHDLVVTVSAT
jgi:hypothetical protein